MMSLFKTHPLLKLVNLSFITLPCPSSISTWWNFGSMLGLCLSVQLVSGMVLAMHYIGDVSLAFHSVSHLCRDVNWGWLIRALHANGASAFFVCLYCHVGRGMYYGSASLHATWSIGVVLLLAVMAAAFMGYVLPWGQMSFWAATVITNLFSAIPYLGTDIVAWLWGGFAVDAATLTRFFAFHFLIPFILAAMAGVHLLFLHQTGSNNPLGARMNTDKLPFHPYFTTKDMVGFMAMIMLLMMVSLISPWASGDPENFIQANPLVTPTHIQPEWYFLFAYAILRSIPNKLGGVIALAMSVLVLLMMALQPMAVMRTSVFSPPSKFLFWSICSMFILLTWIGACPVEPPYIFLGQGFSLAYFMYFMLEGLTKRMWGNILI